MLQAADRAHIGRTTWTAVESGKGRMPKPETLARIAEAIRLPPADLLRVAGQRSAAAAAELRARADSNDPAVMQRLDEIARGIQAVQEALQRLADRLGR